MDPVKFPLNAWAYGGYEEVIRLTGWSRPKARREVRKVIKAYGFKLIGKQGYRQLRQLIMDGQVLDHELN